MRSIGIGIGAGLVSALLFGVVITGSPLAMLLSYLAPLPILIAALGWHHRAGLAAALVGSVTTAAVFRPEAGVAFALGSALPGWGFGYLALLGRPRADAAQRGLADHVGQKAQEAGALDRLSEFTLLLGGHRRDTRGHDLAAL